MPGKRQLPQDLLLVIGLVFFTDILVFVPVLNESFLRTGLSIFLILFLPGYALTAALFPAKKDIEGLERAIISLGLSIAIVPILGLVLNYTNWGIKEIPVLAIISFFTIAICAVAYYRRSLLPETEVFEISIKSSLLNLKSKILVEPESKTDKAITVLLVIFIVASIGSLAYMIGNPKQGEPFTEFYVLGENKTADYYPTEFLKGQEGTIVVGVSNHEYKRMDYTMVIKLENQTLPLAENRRQISLEDNETWEEPITFTPSVEGKDMKLEILLFNETEKAVPYRNLHLWINVSKGV